jgi:hypothetical protein
VNDASNNSSSEPETKKRLGWFPGKFMAVALGSTSSKEEAASEDSTKDAPEKVSSFSRLSRMLSAKSSIASTDASADDDRDRDETEDEKKDEKLIVKISRKIRNKLIARKLVGKIFVHRLSGIVVTKMTCFVEENDIATDDSEEFDPFEEVSGNFKRAITMTDAVLNSLERRSRAWDGVDFADNVTLTRGVTLGVSDPFVGFIGFSWTFEITCTVKSLLASRKLFEAARDRIAQLYPPGGRTSSSFSLSFSSSSAQLEQLRKQVNKKEVLPTVSAINESNSDSDEEG